jgi:uncharacterized protein (TIGR02147 family)
MNYRQYLTREFDRRCQRNSRYSLRAFARDLGLPASRLSEILRVQSGLSESAAEKLIPKLNIAGADAEFFKVMVAAEHSRSQIRRQQAQKRLQELQQNQEFPIFDSEKAKVIADWYHSAILELTDVHDFQSDEAWLAKRLGLSLGTVQSAVQRLFQLGLLKKVGDRWLQTEQQLSFQSLVPNLEFKKHHLQMLEKAKMAIMDLGDDEREVSSLTFAIDSEQLPEFKKILRAIRKKLMSDASAKPTKDRVFGLSLHLFPVDQSTKSRALSSKTFKKGISSL